MTAPSATDTHPTPPAAEVVRLPPVVAERVREMAEDMGGDLTAAQVVRRGLILLDFFLALAPGEVMAVLDTQTGAVDRVAFDFDAAEQESERSGPRPPRPAA